MTDYKKNLSRILPLNKASFFVESKLPYLGRKQNMKTKTKIILAVLGILIAGFIGFYINGHNFDWRTPIKFQSPLVISTKSFGIKTIIQTVHASENISPLTPDQQYGCNLFGKDCATFLAIFRAESNYRHDAININSNNTVDFGCMQINSVHLKAIDTSKVNLLNCQQNIDVAFSIYQQQKGFGAWVAYTSGAYKQYLLNQ